MTENKHKSRGITFLGVYKILCGRIIMNIQGNETGAFPELPMQPGNQEFSRKTQFIALDISERKSKQIAEHFFVRICFILLATVVMLIFWPPKG